VDFVGAETTLAVAAASVAVAGGGVEEHRVLRAGLSSEDGELGPPALIVAVAVGAPPSAVRSSRRAWG
jgi:hypothetical protein